MKNFLLIFAILLIMIMNTACSERQIEDLIHGPPEDPRQHTGVDPAFRLYVNMFEEGIGSEVYGIPVTFENMEPGRKGQCFIYEDRGEVWKEVKISRQAWRNMSDLERKFSIFHELGHCVLGEMYHTNDLREDGCAFSIMHTYMPSEACLIKYEDDYEFNLFN